MSTAPRWVVGGFVALVVGIAAHVVVVVRHEPFAFDAWNIAAATHDHGFSLTAWAEYAWDQYTTGNPRLGQTLAYLGYKVPWTTAVLTPIAWLGLIVGIVALGLGRRPSLRDPRDLALAAFVAGAAWVVLPFPGTIVFTRAYAANYLYPAAFQLWFLYVVRRFDAPWVVNARRWQCAAFAVAGVIAGACNEHTGPMLVVVTAGAAAYVWRARGERRGLLIAGAIGVAAGTAWLLFAPGHSVHYDNLAGEAGLAQRALARGVAHNAAILRDYLHLAAPVLLVTVLVFIGARGHRDLTAGRRALGVALGAGLVVVVTLFASPKLGPRFFFLPLALLFAAFVQLVADARPGRRATIALAALGVAVSGYFASATITLYQRLHAASDVRLAELARAAARPGEPAVVTPWEVVDMQWLFWGDDFRDPRKRRLVQDYLGTGPIAWFGPLRTAPLGVRGIGFSIDLEPRGIDQATYQPASWEVDIPLLTRQLEHVARSAATRPDGLTAAALRVRLPVAPANLPALPLEVARWTPASGAESFATAVRYVGASGRTRAATIAPALAGAAWYLWPIGLPARAAPTAEGRVTFELAPGRTHWLVACLPERCVVTAVAR